MNLTIPNSITSVPTAMPPNMEKAVRMFSSKLVSVGLGHEIMLSDAPTPEQRDGLDRRSARIAQWLQPCVDQSRIRTEVATVLGTMATRGGSDMDAEITINIYVSDLAGLPFFAIAAACSDFRQGRAGDKKWAPSQAEIREVACRHMSVIAIEKAKIDAVLKAKIVETEVDPAKRSKVADLAREAARRISMQGVLAERQRMEKSIREVEGQRETEREEQRKVADALDKAICAGQPDPRPMPMLSDEVRQKYTQASRQRAAE